MTAGFMLGLLLAAAACTPRASEPPPEDEESSCNAPGVREVVERFGERLRQVPLLAPDSVFAEAARTAYMPLVTDSLLQAWIAEPATAPGREVSSPWPERIEVRSVQPAGEGLCRVNGDVIYVTSADAPDEAVHSKQVSVRVEHDGEWRISAYQAATGTDTTSADPDATTSDEEPTDVLYRYYEAINARDFRSAYQLWGDGASGETFEEFQSGFSETARVDVEIGEPGRLESAAGSQYVEVPVAILAVTTSGEDQRFEGTYTLRRGMVEGADPRWHIYDATISRVR